jgi:hypothetical protein
LKNQTLKQRSLLSLDASNKKYNFDPAISSLQHEYLLCMLYVVTQPTNTSKTLNYIHTPSKPVSNKTGH